MSSRPAIRRPRTDPGAHPLEPWLRDVLTVAVGLGTGVLSGMFGVGGAVLSTPCIRALGAAPTIAIGSTIPSILPSAVVGTYTYTRERLVDLRMALLAGAIGTGFSVLGASLTPIIPGDGHLQQLATAALLCFSSWRVLRDEKPAPSVLADPPESRPAEETVPGRRRADAPPAHQPLVVMTTGAGAGLVSGLLGIGGGVIMVPAFSELLGLSMKRAVATSLMIVGMLAIPAGLTHWSLGNIDWRFALWLTVGVVPGARIGSRITVASRARTIRQLFGTFLLVLGSVYGIAETIALFN